MNAIPVIVVLEYNDQGSFTPVVQPKAGGRPRNSGFWQGTWMNEDQTLFVILETGAKVEASTPQALLDAVKAYRQVARKAA